MRVNSNLFETAMKQLSNFTADSNVRPTLTGIHVHYEMDDVLVMEACDSYILNTFKIPVERCEYDSDVDIVIEPFKFKAGTYDLIEINFNEMYIRYADGKRISLNTVREADSYPILTNVIPKDEPKMTVSFNVKELLKAIKGLNKDDVVTFNVLSEVKPVILESRHNKELSENTMIISPCKRY